MGYCNGCQKTADSRFCPDCGDRIQSSCAHCSQDLTGTEKFCPNCGSPAEAGPTQASAEPAPAPPAEAPPTAAPPAEAPPTAAPPAEVPPTAAPPPPEPPPGMTLVPGSHFSYGENGETEELDDFFIDKNPVTNADYARFLLATGIRPPLFWRNDKYPEGRGDHPVVGIHLGEARAYASWKEARLPTEIEWEKAARGVDGRTYPWGNSYREDCLNTKNTGVKDTTTVGRYPAGASPYGCVDMAGNVWEWTESWHDDTRRFKVLRGGSWYDIAAFCKTTTRFSAKTNYRSACIGFRCVVGQLLPSTLTDNGPSDHDHAPPARVQHEVEKPLLLGETDVPLPEKQVLSNEDFLPPQAPTDPSPAPQESTNFPLSIQELLASLSPKPRAESSPTARHKVETGPEPSNSDRIATPMLQPRSEAKRKKRTRTRKGRPSFPDLDRALNLFDAAEESVRRDRSVALITVARSEAAAGHINASIRTWKQVLSIVPNHPEANHQIAALKMKKNKPAHPPRSTRTKSLREASIRFLHSNARHLRFDSRSGLSKIAVAAAIVLMCLMGVVAFSGESADSAGPRLRKPRKGGPRHSSTPADLGRKNPSDASPAMVLPGRERALETPLQDGRADERIVDEMAHSRSAQQRWMTPPSGMTLVPTGPFLFGASDVEMHIEAFYIDTHEVTNAEYENFVQDTNHLHPLHWTQGGPPPDTENHPVTFVSFEDALAYATWAEKRLPTELEWEKATRGTDGKPYPWGVSFAPSRANMLQSVDDLLESGGLKPVGSYPRGQSDYGCFDLIGNALEWTTDCLNPGDSRVRILKGGAWNMAREEGVAHARYGFFPADTRNEFIGFRCAVDAYHAPED